MGYSRLSCGKDRAELPVKCGVFIILTDGAEFPSVVPLRMADADRNTHGTAADAAAEKDPIASEDARGSEELRKTDAKWKDRFGRVEAALEKLLNQRSEISLTTRKRERSQSSEGARRPMKIESDRRMNLKEETRARENNPLKRKCLPNSPRPNARGLILPLVLTWLQFLTAKS